MAFVHCEDTRLEAKTQAKYCKMLWIKEQNSNIRRAILGHTLSFVFFCISDGKPKQSLRKYLLRMRPSFCVIWTQSVVCGSWCSGKTRTEESFCPLCARRMQVIWPCSVFRVKVIKNGDYEGIGMRLNSQLLTLTVFQRFFKKKLLLRMNNKKKK